MRWALVTFLLLLSTPAAAAALPPHTRVHLDYTARDPGCPRAQFLEDVLRGRTSYDPLSDAEETRLMVTITRNGRMYKARAEVRSKAGALLYERELGPSTDCQHIVEGLGFAVSVALDPVGGERPVPQPPSPPPAPPALEPPVKQAPAPPLPAPEPPPKEAPFRLRAGAQVALGIGVAPRPAAGVAIDVGLRWPTISLALEGRAYPPAEGAADTGLVQLRTWQITGAVVPCGHWRWLFGCGVVEMGALSGMSAARTAEVTTLFRVAGGLRGGVEWQGWEHVALRASGDVLFNPWRSELLVNNEPAWTTRVVSGSFGAGVVVSF